MDPIDFHDSTSMAELFYDFFMDAVKRRTLNDFHYFDGWSGDFLKIFKINCKVCHKRMIVNRVSAMFLKILWKILIQVGKCQKI